jgi:Sensors of blue-light using FAD
VALGDVFTQARSNSKKKHITGALLVSGDWFAQVLEGDESLVRDLYATIGRDTPIPAVAGSYSPTVQTAPRSAPETRAAYLASAPEV